MGMSLPLEKLKLTWYTVQLFIEVLHPVAFPAYAALCGSAYAALSGNWYCSKYGGPAQAQGRARAGQYQFPDSAA